MLRYDQKPADCSRRVPPERERTGPLRGSSNRILQRGPLLAAALCIATLGAGDALAQGGLEVASRSAHRTAPRFPSPDASRTQQAEHRVAVGDEARGFVQPAQYVPRSRLMQNRMAARGAYPTHGQMLYDDASSVQGETIYEGDAGGEFIDGEVIYDGGMAPVAMPGRPGLLGRMGGGGMGRGPLGGDMIGGPGCCGGGGPVWQGASSCGCESGGCDTGFGMDCGGGCGDPCGMPACGNSCGGCNGCLVPCGFFTPNSNVEVFAGATGFKGVPNFGASGSFGFYEGFLFSGPLPCMPGEPISWELGGNFVQSDYEGSAFTANSRQQIFGTAGLFRRVDWGMQGGAVLDYMYDHWYQTSNLMQLRGEISWVYPSGHEFGLWGTMGLNQDIDEAQTIVFGTVNQVDLESRPIDLYCAFYRQQFCDGGNGRLFGGFTGDANGIVGADFTVPVTCNWAVQGGFTFLIPQSSDERDNTGAFDVDDVPTEAWNVNVGVVWSFGGKLKDRCNYHRALLGPANNGNFFMNRSLPN